MDLRIAVRSAVGLLGVVTLAATGLAVPAPAPALTWGATVTDLDVPGDDWPVSPQVEVSADGTRAVAVWTSDEGRGGWVVKSAVATLTGSGATWGPATTVSVPVDVGGPGLLDGPQVRVSVDGTRATAVWIRGRVVQSASAVVDGTTATWGRPRTLSTPPGGGGDNDDSLPVIGSSTLAASADGTRVTAVWTRYGVVQAASAVVDGTTATWGRPARLSSPLGGNGPQVDLSADGTRAVVVWDRSYHTVVAVAGVVDGASATWGTQVDLSRDATGSAPVVALSADGAAAVAVWDGGDGMVRSASATLTGSVATWGSVSVLSHPEQFTHGATVALSADGTRATAVWRRSDGEIQGDAMTVLQSASAVVTGTTATWGAVADISESGHQTSGEQLVLSADGTAATVSWSGTCGSDWLARTRSATVSGGSAVWADAVSLSPPADRVLAPSLGQSGDGTRAVLAWVDNGAPATRLRTVFAGPEAAPAVVPAVCDSWPLEPPRILWVRTSVEGRTVTARWAVSLRPIGFLVEVSPDRATWTPAGSTGPRVQSFRWRQGQPGRTYYLRVAATYEAGQGSWSKPARVTIPRAR